MSHILQDYLIFISLGNNFSIHKNQLVSFFIHKNSGGHHACYGNTGCGVFKRGIQNKKDFWLKIDCSQIKLLNFKNWSSGELLKIGHHFRK